MDLKWYHRRITEAMGHESSNSTTSKRDRSVMREVLTQKRRGVMWDKQGVDLTARQQVRDWAVPCPCIKPLS